MTTISVIKEVSKKSNQSQRVVREVLKAVETTVCEMIANGDNFKVANVNFGIKHANERSGFNPQTGEKITIPAGRKLSIKASSKLKKIAKAGKYNPDEDSADTE